MFFVSDKFIVLSHKHNSQNHNKFIKNYYYYYSFFRIFSKFILKKKAKDHNFRKGGFLWEIRNSLTVNSSPRSLAKSGGFIIQKYGICNQKKNNRIFAYVISEISIITERQNKYSNLFV